jgi:hypothetical protein
MLCYMQGIPNWLCFLDYFFLRKGGEEYGRKIQEETRDWTKIP